MVLIEENHNTNDAGIAGRSVKSDLGRRCPVTLTMGIGGANPHRLSSDNPQSNA